MLGLRVLEDWDVFGKGDYAPLPVVETALCLSPCLRQGTHTDDVSISDRTGSPGSGSPVKIEEHVLLLSAKVARGTGPLEVGGEGSVYLLLLPWLHSPLIQQQLHVVILMVVPHGTGNHPGLGLVLTLARMELDHFFVHLTWTFKSQSNLVDPPYPYIHAIWRQLGPPLW